jgi:hypothetical protein
MGKKSKYSKLGYFGQAKADDKMAKKFGISKDNFTTDNHGGGRYEQFNDGAYKKAIARAAANDYDTRRSIEAAKEAGNKKAENLGNGISNMSEAYAAERFMKKTHKNRMGNTGAYDGANDEGNVTNYWLDKARQNRDSNLATVDDLNSLRDDLEKQEEATNYQTRPIEKSDALARAEDRLTEADHSPGSIYGQNNNSAATDNAPVDASKHFLYDYKEKIKEAYGPLTNTEREVSNAAKCVQDPFGR